MMETLRDPEICDPPAQPNAGATAARPRESSGNTPTRTFLVGCPRSGTTFLQAALASHPDVCSLPETSFLERVLPGRVDAVVTGMQADKPRGAHCRARAFFRFRRRAQRHLRRFADELGIAVDARDTHLALGGFLGAFANLFDRAAVAHDCCAGIEKTPNHVFYLDEIERHVANARFIHLLRRGEDVVASIFDASLRYAVADNHQAFSQSVAWWVAYWNAAVETHSSHAGAANHCIVFYEDLVDSFDSEYARLCRFIGVEVLPAGTCVADDVADLDREPWKQNAVSGALRPGTQIRIGVRSRCARVDSRAAPSLRRHPREPCGKRDVNAERA